MKYNIVYFITIYLPRVRSTALRHRARHSTNRSADGVQSDSTECQISVTEERRRRLNAFAGF